MRHYGLWLEKYGSRRAQILANWAGSAKAVHEIRSKIPRDKLFAPMRECGKSSYTMAFVDGGEGMRELLGLGIYFIRASGLILSGGAASQGELFERDLDMNVIDYDEHTKERVEMLRDGMEFDVAIKCAKEHKPDILFLDGSLYVKGRRSPIECGEYELYRKKYARLLRLCKSEKIRLVGVSEDSKSRMLSNHLSSQYKVKFPKFMTDSTILRLLSPGGLFRSIQFTPHSMFEAEDRIEPGIVANFPTAYLQPTEISNPLRIDVPDWEADFDEIISIVGSLCRGSGHYGYPMPLYIAHLDAHIPPAQMDWTQKQIVSYLRKQDATLGNAVLGSTRRNLRPK